MCYSRGASAVPDSARLLTLWSTPTMKLARLAASQLLKLNMLIDPDQGWTQWWSKSEDGGLSPLPSTTPLEPSRKVFNHSCML
jgi:hypothetical protein